MRLVEVDEIYSQMALAVNATVAASVNSGEYCSEKNPAHPAEKITMSDNAKC